MSAACVLNIHCSRARTLISLFAKRLKKAEREARLLPIDTKAVVELYVRQMDALTLEERAHASKAAQP